MDNGKTEKPSDKNKDEAVTEEDGAAERKAVDEEEEDEEESEDSEGDSEDEGEEAESGEVSAAIYSTSNTPTICHKVLTSTAQAIH